MAYSIINRSCNKVLIGRTYWQSVALSSILFGAPVITFNKNEIQELQVSENKVCRFMLGGLGYVAIPALKGELGMTSILYRDMRAKLKYVHWLMNGDNNITKLIFQDFYLKGKAKLIKKIKEYMNNLGMENLDEMVGLSESALVSKIDLLEERNWKEQMNQRSTLIYYREYKQEIKQEIIYDNNWRSVLLFRSRTNSLKLNWRNSFTGGNTDCKMCQDGLEETVKHFIVDCMYFSDLREEHGLLGRELVDLLLFNDCCDVDVVKEYLEKAWKRRSSRLKEISQT